MSVVDHNERSVHALRELADAMEKSSLTVSGQAINHALSVTTGASDADRLLSILMIGVETVVRHDRP